MEVEPGVGIYAREVSEELHKHDLVNSDVGAVRSLDIQCFTGRVEPDPTKLIDFSQAGASQINISGQ